MIIDCDWHVLTKTYAPCLMFPTRGNLQEPKERDIVFLHCMVITAFFAKEYPHCDPHSMGWQFCAEGELNPRFARTLPSHG